MESVIELLAVIVPLVAFSLDFVRNRRQPRVHSAEEADKVTGASAEYVTMVSKELSELRRGVRKLDAQLRRAGLTPEWHMNGSTTGPLAGSAKEQKP